MTAAQILLAAADLLEKRAGEATRGPWETYRVQGPSGNEAWGVTSPEPNDEGDRTAVAMVEAYHPTYEPNGGCWDEADATYIATMHPEAGRAGGRQAAILRAFGVAVEREWRGFHEMWKAEQRVRMLNDRMPGLAEALDLADLLLAGAS